MKLALIPPLPDLGHFDSTGIHLTIAKQLVEHPHSWQYYRDRSRDGDYVILDNGAHEEGTISFPELLRFAGDIGAQEVVIPDYPHNTYETLASLHETLDWLNKPAGRLMYSRAGSPHLMIVPHVLREPDRTDEYASIATAMVGRCCASHIPPNRFTVGIALMYDDLNGGLMELVDRIAWLVEDSGPAIHLLGWSRNLQTPIEIAKRFPSAVRSVDTCKPFVYARAGIMFSARTTDLVGIPPYPGRPDDYFERKLNPEERFRGNFNANVFKTLLLDARLSQLSEPMDAVSEAYREETADDSAGLPDGTGSEEGTSTRR